MTTTATGEILDLRRLLDDRRAARRYCVGALYVLFALSGAAQVVSRDNGLIHLLIPLMLACAATLWAITDSRLRGHHLLPVLRILFFFTWPLAALVYLVATRRWRGVGWWVLHAVALLATISITFFLTYLALFSMGLIAPHINP